MRLSTLGFLCLFSSVALVAQTHEAAPPIPRSQDGGVRAVLESIVIPPIPNHPFSATLDTEWVQYAGEGATVTLVNERPTSGTARAAFTKSAGRWCRSRVGSSRRE